MIAPYSAYKILLQCFGPQGWWPLTPKDAIRPRYRPGRFAKANSRQALEICVGAILTQNTAWSNVEKALENLHSSKALHIQKLNRLPQRALEKLIRSSGFFVQKAIKLKTFVRHLCKRGAMTKWLKEPLPMLRAELLSIKGIGRETADSILLYAGARPIFVVDAYTRRIGERLGWLEPSLSYDSIQHYFMSRIPCSPKIYQEFHALLVALAKAFCRTKPLCPSCPLLAHCPHGKSAYRTT